MKNLLFVVLVLMIGIVSNDFEKVDTDGDGYLSIDEFENVRKLKANKKGERRRPNPEEAFKMMDVNEDGKISEKEAKGPLAEHFERIDINKDGFIDKDEISKIQKRRNQRRGPRNN
ncbi:MAG: EF-hand domain-containing protein [bacterium]